ncbi:hypothetical protein PLEOSDRAFT_171221 [Pleurotus ostreatus PC15]|uniref:ATP-dependent DNA helicase n=1 Tax=Pleurotus ostreatus (strain PC15) TaxID=1137138 RepID=A0A067N915_PLEO1|nr:hypothetical protein PLEOSDRAFT_171221 [Pleurotus ostreatus PC15]
MAEAVGNLATPRQLRVLMVHMLVNDCVALPRDLWNSFAADLSRDYILAHGNSIEVGTNLALEDMGRLLEEYGKCLPEYGLPEPVTFTREVEHELLRWAPIHGTLATRGNRALQMLNTEQGRIAEVILTAARNRQRLTLFIDGKAGRGKTFLVNAICDVLRSEGRIVIPTATAAFAAQLYPGGRTTHSAFKHKSREATRELS